MKPVSDSDVFLPGDCCMPEWTLTRIEFRRLVWAYQVQCRAISNKQKAISMSKELVAHNKPVFDQLHPRIYGAAVGLIAWFALMAWVLFDHGGGQVSLALTFMTVLFVVAVTLPWTLSLVWRKSRLPSERHPQPASLHDWKAGEFAVWGAKL